ncbi:MAG: hypothetical protein KKC80_06985 [Candidatus Margulisbacteria bacterium]|nr:hypothetical protein [Candidatus Margulisiibacteriota bacterium]MBU1617549.1 hypothetical protein [Candidatus Margulisiibacteriota bacterium]MBU1867212.1 hypothetical protein [Candidatus Margulisiibacteriota bacterium]
MRIEKHLPIGTIHSIKPINGCKFTPLVIPDRSVITGCISVCGEQSVKILFPELGLEGLVTKLKKMSPESVIQEAAKLNVISTPNPTRSLEKWHQAIDEDRIYSLGEAIAEQMCTCFHRSIHFNLLMARMSIPSTILSGLVVESPDCIDLERIRGDRPSHWGLSKIDKRDYHGTNLVYYNGQHIFVDTAMLIDEKPLTKPFDHPDTRNFPLSEPLPDNRYRYYNLKGSSIEVTADASCSV